MNDEAIMPAALRDIGLERVKTPAALRGDAEAFVADDERISVLESENSKLRLDVDENVAYGKLQGERIRMLEKERDELNARLLKLEDACRNVLTTDPPPLKEVEGAWNKCVLMDEYRDWFHRQFNLDQVSELMEHSNADNG